MADPVTPVTMLKPDGSARKFNANQGQPGDSTMSVALPFQLPAPWSDQSKPYDARMVNDVEVQFTGVFSAYTVLRSLDGATFFPTNIYDKDGMALDQITVPGIYGVDGGGFLRLDSGTGASVTIRAGA